jgi:hypothetical protein
VDFTTKNLWRQRRNGTRKLFQVLWKWSQNRNITSHMTGLAIWKSINIFSLIPSPSVSHFFFCLYCHSHRTNFGRGFRSFVQIPLRIPALSSLRSVSHSRAIVPSSASRSLRAVIYPKNKRLTCTTYQAVCFRCHLSHRKPRRASVAGQPFALIESDLRAIAAKHVPILLRTYEFTNSTVVDPGPPDTFPPITYLRSTA